MRDYVEALELRLVLAAREQQQPPLADSGTRAAAVRSLGRARIRATALVARDSRVQRPLLAAACLIGAFMLIGLLADAGGSRQSSALALPVLRGPAHDARMIRSRTPQLVHADVSFQDARQIATPYGTGYVVPSADGGELCLAIPDPVDGYGEGCSTTSQAAQQGLYATLVRMSAATGDVIAASEFVAVLPAGASDPVVRYADGTTSDLPIQGGVAATLIARQATITLQIGAIVRTVSIPAAITCSGSLAQAPTDAETDGHFQRETCQDS